VLDLKKGLADADSVSVNLDLNPSTWHIIGRDALLYMKPSAYLINTSRGPVIDQIALTETLRDRRIAGAALDVLEQEPPTPCDPILKLDNVIVLPHIDGRFAAPQERSSLTAMFRCPCLKTSSVGSSASIVRV
jgi:phosphoglycerate dehydrogenase-like enzyme